MSLKVTTDRTPVMVFRNEKTSASGIPYTNYAISISSKQEEGWVTDYIDCLFKKGVSLEPKTKIFIQNAFFVVREINGRKYKKLMITDFEIDKPKEGFVDVPSGTDDELPFN